MKGEHLNYCQLPTSNDPIQEESIFNLPFFKLRMHSSILGVQHFIFTSLLVNAVNFAFSATLDEWRSRSIYQVLTDRYATTLGNDTQCNLSQSSYCGGTFLGILDNLDYIQTMGFTAVGPSSHVNLPYSAN